MKPLIDLNRAKEIDRIEEFRNFGLYDLFTTEYKHTKSFNNPKNINGDFLEIILENGEISDKDLPQGIIIIKEKTKKNESFNPIININNEFIDEQITIKINGEIDKPIKLVNRYSSTNNFISTNILFIIEDHSDIHILEETVSLDSIFAINNRFFEVKDAKVNYSRIDRITSDSNLIYNYKGAIGKGSLNAISNYNTGKKVINIWDISLIENNGQCNIMGVITKSDKQKHGTICKITHEADNTKSKQEFRHVLDDEAFAMYDGDSIIVNKAKDSITSQHSKTIMLSQNTRIYNKPRLNIYTGEVKAEHGATIGKLNPEDIFYLKQRGLPYNLIKKLLVDAFINDLLNRIKSEKVLEVINEKG